MIPLKCAGCGAGLEISLDIDVFSCRYCGTNQKIKYNDGVVELQLINKSITHIQQSTDRTVSELAFHRLKQELIDVERRKKTLWDIEYREQRGIAVMAWIIFIISIFTIGTWSILLFLIEASFYFYFYITRQKALEVVSEELDKDIAKLKWQIAAHRQYIEQVF
jgi:hypothetical protein